MKKIMIYFLVVFTLIFMISGCTEKEDNNKKNKDENATTAGPILLEDSTAEQGTWEFYNERAEAFVKNMANGYFDTAFDMMDETMQGLMSATSLQTDVWNVLRLQAGKYIDIHEIENLLSSDGYYVCFVTSKHENRGVTLRVVFSENGLVSGLFVDGFPDIEESG